jgi:hypothetical protein
VALAAIAFVGTNSLLGVPLLLLAVFFYAVDVHGIDKRKSVAGEAMSASPVIYGVPGEYVVDATPSFGLFVRLCGRPVFVDIKQDRLEATRIIRARFLYEHQTELDEQLGLFVSANPRFATRSIQYIGLHSVNVDQGEVFWDPDGYTTMKGMTFTA